MIWAILPVKRFDAAKSRLSSVRTSAERAALARSMFEHVMAVLGRSPALAGILVATDSADVENAALRLGASVLRDPPGARTLADVVDAAVDAVARRGATGAIVLVSDLPEVTGHDVARLASALADSDVVLARDAGGEHTNALALRLASAFRTSFGASDSLRRHREAAERAGLSVAMVDSPTLAFDVDTPDDYARLVARR